MKHLNLRVSVSPEKNELGIVRSHVYLDGVSAAELSGRHQTRKREYNVAFHSSFEVTRTIGRVRALLDQKGSGGIRVVQDKCIPGRRSDNTVLNLGEFKAQNLLELILRESLEDNNLVDPIHELR